ncbi:hypothetical protein BB558_001290 [Smittium angustum]|uniref:UPF3 domain-containing protein n=1 Tax=Smittium angustum TaxID=133377 RepID=A0A2U1JBT0_SMIAN|nr:hypothetical protein BB558_001290 [Smittium angustum]
MEDLSNNTKSNTIKGQSSTTGSGSHFSFSVKTTNDYLKGGTQGHRERNYRKKTKKNESDERNFKDVPDMKSKPNNQSGEPLEKRHGNKIRKENDLKKSDINETPSLGGGQSKDLKSKPKRNEFKNKQNRFGGSTDKDASSNIEKNSKEIKNVGKNKNQQKLVPTDPPTDKINVQKTESFSSTIDTSNKSKQEKVSFKNSLENSINAPRLKVVIRRLPPDLPENVFWKSIESHLPWYKKENEGENFQTSKKDILQGDTIEVNSITGTSITTPTPHTSDKPTSNVDPSSSQDNSNGSVEAKGEGPNSSLVNQENLNQINEQLPTKAIDNSLFKSENLKRLDTFPYWRLYVKGKNSKRESKISIPSRAYIGFKTPEELVQFQRSYHGHIFVSKNRIEYRSLVEIAPFQSVPVHIKGRKDNLSGTIKTDPGFLAFVKVMENASENANPDPTKSTVPLGQDTNSGNKPVDDLGVSKSVIGIDVSMTADSAQKKGESTALLDYLKSIKIKERRRGERNHPDKKQRDSKKLDEKASGKRAGRDEKRKKAGKIRGKPKAMKKRLVEENVKWEPESGKPILIAVAPTQKPQSENKLVTEPKKVTGEEKPPVVGNTQNQGSKPVRARDNSDKNKEKNRERGKNRGKNKTKENNEEKGSTEHKKTTGGRRGKYGNKSNIDTGPSKNAGEGMQQKVVIAEK